MPNGLYGNENLVTVRSKFLRFIHFNSNVYPKKLKEIRCFGSKNQKYGSHIIRKPNNRGFLDNSLSIKNYYLLQKRSNYKARLTSKIFYRHPKAVLEQKIQ